MTGNSKPRRKIYPFLFLAVMLGLYLRWSASGRGGYQGSPKLNIRQVIEQGKNSGAGNILLIQPWMSGEDYSSAGAFSAKLQGYFAEAASKKWLTPNTVVVLPEYLGAWLLCAGDKQTVWAASTLTQAMKWKIISNAPQTAYEALLAPSPDRLRYALFKSNAVKIAAIYDQTLSTLANKYHVTIIGGSTILPSPSVVGGRLHSGRGLLYNVTPVYQPNGKAYADLVTKAFPTEDEKSFVSPGDVKDLPVFKTSVGVVGVLICADSWFPEAYQAFREKGAEMVLVPSFITGRNSLDLLWDGYSGFAPPEDVRKSDIKRIRKLDAWKRYALPGRLAKSGIRDGLMVCLNGQFWGMEADPCTFIVHDTKIKEERITDGAALINIWVDSRK